MAQRPHKSNPVKFYRVGGSVRDELLGRRIVDRDWVVTGATPEMLIASGYRPVGRDFPVFLHPETREEYALARTERKHGRGYRGFEFFVSPEVTLEEDLARRDLTINAMARDAEGALIDPFGGEADLRAGVLRHVSPAFVEDPLRVLRVARFAARFGFSVAPDTAKLMRRLVATGELAELAPERVWQELARGLMERSPSRMLAVLRDCGALARLLPEVDAGFGKRRRGPSVSGADGGACVEVALDHAAARGLPLPARYAILVHDFRGVSSRIAGRPKHRRGAIDGIRLAEQVSSRLKAPADCREVARLAARRQSWVDRARELPPAKLLDLITAADALRRPERLDMLLEACECMALPGAGRAGEYPPARIVRAALAVVRGVDAGAIARRAGNRGQTTPIRRDSHEPLQGQDKRGLSSDAVGKAVRAARLEALRGWRRANRTMP